MRRRKASLALTLATLFFLTLLLVDELPSAGAQTQPSTVASINPPPIAFSETSTTLRLNFTMFVVQFDKSSGSSTIYNRDGSVLAYYHFITLQYFNTKVSGWRQSGVFTGLTWVKHSDTYYSVVEYFVDQSTSPQTNYTVTYSIRSDSPMKISVRIESGASRQYRLVWSLDGITYSSWVERKNSDNIKNRLVFGDENTPCGWMALDWQDVYEKFKSDVSSYSVSTSAQGRKADIYFDLGTVGAGQVLVVDPSLVGSSSSDVAIADYCQRKTFYANGRYWVFYSDGTNMVYKTSTDGSTWTSATTVASVGGGYGLHFSIWFDGTYLHYARLASGGGLYYRRGTPNSDGTITWSAAEQTVVSSLYAGVPSIAVDSNGYPWIGYQDYSSNGFLPFITKSSTTGGVWSTASGFPYQLSSTTSNGWAVMPVPLTNGKMAVLYASGLGPVNVITWDGSAWRAAVSTASSAGVRAFSAVAQGDDVHIVFSRYSDYAAIYVKYTYSTNSLSSETVLRSSYTWPTITIDTSTNYLYVTMRSSLDDTIYYSKYTGSWSTPTSIWTRSTLGYLSSFYQFYGGKYGLAAEVYESSTYNIYFFTSLNSPPNAPALNSPAASSRFNPGASVQFTWTFSDPDSGDSQSAYQLQIGNSDFSTIYVDTNKVSSSSSSATVTLPSTVGLYYWRVKTWDSQNAEGSWSSGRAIIVDRIKVNSLSANDNRLDVGASVTLTVQLVYEYDNSYIASGSFTLNGLTLSYTGSSGNWQTSDSKSSVQAVTYNSVSGTEGTYSLTAVNMNGLSTTVIWDRFEIYSVSVDDARINVGGTFELRYKIRYDYDDVVFDSSKGSVSGFTWDATNGWWKKTVTGSSSVGATVYDETYITITDNTYGLTAKQDVAGVAVITDRVKVISYSVSDSRVNVGDSVNVNVTLQYEYDSVAVTDGSVTVNGISATHLGSGVWRISVSQSSVTSVTYNTVACSGNTYGITAVNQNSQSATVIWDRFKIISIVADDTRRDVGTTVTLDVTIKYEYDNSAVTTGGFTLNGLTLTHQGSGVWRTTDSRSSVQAVTYNSVSGSGDTYGLTAVNMNGQSVTVIWDQIYVYSSSVSDSRANVGDTVYVDVTLKYSYDNGLVTSGSFSINGNGATHQGSGVWRISVSQSSVTSATYNSVSGSDGAYGLSSINQNGWSKTVIWDRIKVVSLTSNDDRLNIGASVTLTVQLVYEYDGASVTTFSGTLNGLTLSNAGGGSYTASDSSSSVQMKTYNSLSGSESTYGLSAINMNSKSASVIWDKVVLTSLYLTYSGGSVLCATAALAYDNHQLGSGDSLSINGTAMSWNSANGRFEASVSTPGKYNTLTSCYEATYGITVGDANGLSATLNAVSVSQSTTVSDSPTRFFSGGRSISQPSTISDSPARVFSGSRLPSEALTISPDAARSLSGFRSGSDGFTLSDSPTRAYTGGRAPTQPITLLDTPSRAFTGSRSSSDLFTLTESPSRVYLGGRNPAQTVTLLDTPSRAFTGSRSESDLLTLSDALSRIFMPLRILNEVLSPQDAVGRVFTGLRSLTDSFSLSDALGRIYMPLRLISESLSISDASARVFTGSRSVDSTFGLSDVLGRIYMPLRTISQSVSLSDAASRVFSGFRSLADSLSPGDALSRIFMPLREVAGSIYLSVATDRLFTGSRDTADSFGLGDASSRVYLPVREVAQSIYLTDMADRVFTGLRGLSASFGLEDVLGRVYTLIRGASEDLTLSEEISASQTLSRMLSDALQALDELGRLPLYVREAAETLPFSDLVDRVVLFVRGFDEPLGIADELSRLPLYVRAVSQQLGLDEVVERLASLTRGFEESFNLTDLAEGVRRVVREIVEYFTPLDWPPDINKISGSSPIGGGFPVGSTVPLTTALAIQTQPLSVTLTAGGKATSHIVVNYPDDVVAFTVESVSFSGSYRDWFQVKTPLPLRFSKLTSPIEERGVLKIEVEVNVPADQAPGTYNVPFSAVISTPSGAPLVVNNYAKLEVQAAPTQGSGTLVLTLAVVFASAFAIPIVVRSVKGF